MYPCMYICIMYVRTKRTSSLIPLIASPSSQQPAELPMEDGTSINQMQGMSGLLAERMAEGGGALCNDRNGRCLGFRGNIDASRSGAYTAIAKLASQLDSTVDGSGGSRDRGDVPLVSIQTEKAVS